MKKVLLICMVVLIIAEAAAIAQVPRTIWNSNFGGSGLDCFYCLTSTPDGGTIAVGYSAIASFGNGDWTGITGIGSRIPIIVKHDSQSNVVWKKNFEYGDRFTSISAMSDGGFIAVGYNIIVKIDSDGNKLWDKSFNSYFNSVKAATDGGFIAAGYLASAFFGNGDWEGIVGKGGDDAIIVKFDSTGNVEWKKNFGSDGYDSFNSITTLDGSFVAAGYLTEGVGYNYDYNAIVVKYDSTGNIIWQHNFDENNDERFYSIKTTQDGGLVAAGHGSNLYNAMLIKYNTDGIILWKKYYNDYNTGFFYDVINLPDGGFAACGSGSSWNNGSNDSRGCYPLLLVGFDGNGNIIWEKSFGGAYTDWFKSITSTTDGSLVAVGYTSSFSFNTGDWTGISGKGASDAIIVKFNNTYAATDLSINPKSVMMGIGETKQLSPVFSPLNAAVQNLTWASTNNTVATVSSTGLVTALSVGNADITASTLDGSFSAVCNVTVESSTSGAWKTNFGGSDSDYYNCVVESQDGGVVAVGYCAPDSFGTVDLAGFSYKGGYDAVIVKYDAFGNIQWKKNFGGIKTDIFTSVTYASDGGFIAVGYSSKGSFDNTDWAGTISKGYDDAIIVKYDANGNIEWKHSFGGAGFDQYSCVVSAMDGGFTVVGQSYNNSFGNGDWAGISSKGGYGDAIIVRYDSNGNILWKNNFGETINFQNCIENFKSVTTALDGGFVAVGHSYWSSYDSLPNAIAVKFDSNGQVDWNSNFGGNAQDYFKSVIASADGGFAAVGYSDNGSFDTGDWSGITSKGMVDATIVKYDSGGNIQWNKNFGGVDSNCFSSVKVLPGGGFAAVGESYIDSLGEGDWERVNGNSSFDAIIVKYDTNGNAIEAKNLGGDDWDSFTSLAVSSNGQIVAVGDTSGFSFGTGGWTEIISKGFDDAVIAKTGIPTSIGGIINLQEWTAANSIPAKIIIADMDNSFEVHNTNLDAASAYLIGTTISGASTISAKASHWLSQTSPANLSSGNSSVFNFSLINGDIDGDNWISISDYNEWVGLYGLESDHPDFDPSCDIDGDGWISIFDYNILIDNYGKVGQ